MDAPIGRRTRRVAPMTFHFGHRTLGARRSRVARRPLDQRAQSPGIVAALVAFLQRRAGILLAQWPGWSARFDSGPEEADAEGSFTS